jgi:hypothetical protein
MVNTMQTDFELMLVRLCLSGPLIYIGLSMALNPEGFVAVLGNVMRSIRNFEQALREPRWQAPMRGPDTLTISGRTRAAFRAAGTAVALIALLHLVGILV